jgi:hypothetical protein
MVKRSLALWMVLLMLLGATLACSTVMGGGVDADDARATADAIEGDAENIQDEAEATAAAAEATADAALNGNDNADANDNGDTGDDDNANDNGDDDNANDNPFVGEGPEDIPIFGAEADVEFLFADDKNVSYYVDAEFDDVLEFYRAEMPNNGWELAANGDTVFGEIASLQYEKDGQLALIAITVDPISSRTTVVATITAQ